MSVKNSDSGTEVSSDSSWTVIEEIQETFSADTDSNTKPNEDVGIEVIRTTEIVTISEVPNDKENDFVNVTFSNTSIKQSSDEETSKNETRENGFLSFDEYLQERMLEHDYEFPNQSTFKKKLNKSRNSKKTKTKCKAETVGVLSLCASLLTVTGIALLCIIFPENIDSKNLETIKSNCQAISNNDSLDYNNIIANLNKTMKVLDAANSSEILSKCTESILNNPEYRYNAHRRTIGPMNEIGSRRIRSSRRYRNSISATSLFKNICYPKSNNGVCYINEDPRLLPHIPKKQQNSLIDPTKFNQDSNSTAIKKPSSNGNKQITALTSIESVLAGTSLKKIIRSIIHDICILKLITYLNKKAPTKDSKKKSNKGEKKASKRKVFEAIADGLERLNYEDNKERKIKTARRKCKTRKLLKHKDNSADNALSVSSEPKCETPQQNFILQYSQRSSSSPKKSELPTKFENGKSECERRFDELDNQRKKSKEVCSKHISNIQQIKQQFRNEVDAIKESNAEPMVRFSKIQSLREKYKLQLKKNREMYMREMSKMKRMRSKMLKELCSQKRIDLEMRDASVGSYVVPIEDGFYNRLQLMKNKEVTVNSQAGSSFQDCNINESYDSVFQIPKSPPFCFPSTKSMEKNVKTVQNQEIAKGSQSKRNFLKPKTRVRSNYEFPSSFHFEVPKSWSVDMENKDKKFTGLVEDSKKNTIEKKKPDSDVSIRCDTLDNSLQDKLYEIAFEKKGPMIENLDNNKWRPKRVQQWERNPKDTNKQDPQKSYRPMIMHYKF